MADIDVHDTRPLGCEAAVKLELPPHVRAHTRNRSSPKYPTPQEAYSWTRSRFWDDGSAVLDCCMTESKHVSFTVSHNP